MKQHSNIPTRDLPAAGMHFLCRNIPFDYQTPTCYLLKIATDPRNIVIAHLSAYSHTRITHYLSYPFMALYTYRSVYFENVDLFNL